MNKKPLIFAHIGDLHITRAQDPNYVDYLAIIAQLETACKDQLDFVILPGDNADQGLPEQYRLVATALKMLSAPVYIIPGDHDREQGSLAAFYEGLAAGPLPKSLLAQGIRCLFLDVIGPGQGGPDFRLGNTQLHWLENEMADAEERKEEMILFMHTYPDDLNDEQEKAALNNLIHKHEVLLVDMGHTHYNELANDGQTIYAATRSTGQIDEGPVGYSLIAADEGVVSWRFKSLQDPFPFVLITSPADYRLIRKKEQRVSREIEVHAVVFGATQIVRVNCTRDQDNWIPMTWQDGRWTATLNAPSEPLFLLTVEAVDERGRPGRHTITVGTSSYKPPRRTMNGSDADSIGAWPENGILGTQLGPNRNTKPWHP
jgi:3',5'-cyclic AMP phosphodiesterase CpdA